MDIASDVKSVSEVVYEFDEVVKGQGVRKRQNVEGVINRNDSQERCV